MFFLLRRCTSPLCDPHFIDNRELPATGTVPWLSDPSETPSLLPAMTVKSITSGYQECLR